MRIIKSNLLDKETEYGFMPTLTGYLVDGNPNEQELRPAVVVIPGGGYGLVSYREGERIALAYSTAGFQTFIVDYCVAPHREPLPILNVAKAIEFIRTNSKEWSVDPDKIAVCGFSAGGHLAASLSTMWNDKTIFSLDTEQNELHKPNASILCYPVITCGEYAHKGSFINLTGCEKENDKWLAYSLENRVDENTPPAFLWHTYADGAVPVENSLLYAKSLREHKIPFEMHIYPDGPHGLSTVSDETYWKVPKFTRTYPWIDQSIEWLYLTFGITKIDKE